MVDVRIRIRGVNTTVRELAKTNDDALKAAHDGCTSAAKYLMGKIKEKFGKYQNTGGDPGGKGAWKKLKLDTRIRKAKHNHSSAPLIGTGEARDSWYVVEGGKGRISASVYSDNDYIIHHIYGAPRAGVPMRDPARITAIEESDKCTEIITKAVEKVIDRS